MKPEIVLSNPNLSFCWKVWEGFLFPVTSLKFLKQLLVSFVIFSWLLLAIVEPEGIKWKCWFWFQPSSAGLKHHRRCKCVVLQALGVSTECDTSSQGRSVAFNVDRYKAEKDVCAQKRLCTPCLECQKQGSFIHLFSLLQMLGKSPSYPLRVRMTAGPADAEGTVTPGVTPWALLPETALLLSVRALDFAAQPRDWC